MVEAIIRRAAAQYLEPSKASVDARGTEIAAFSRVNRELATAADPAQRIRAIGRNHDLWSLLIKDLAQSGNRLPDDLRTSLIELAAWSMRYSILANLTGVPVQPLIDVNANILEGLKAQAARPLSGASGQDSVHPTAYAV